MLKKFIYRWRLKRILENKSLNRRQKCLFLLQLLKGEKLTNQRLHENLNVKLTVIWPCIDVYTRRIRDINMLIDRKASISSDMLSFTPTITVLDVFFTDENNCYVDVNKSFESFNNECTRLMISIADADDAEYGYFEYVHRILINVLLNLEDVTTKIAITLQD